MSITQYLLEPLTLDIPLTQEFEEEDWVAAAASINRVISMVMKGQASIEDIIDAANDTDAIFIDQYLADAEEYAEQRAIELIYGVH